MYEQQIWDQLMAEINNPYGVAGLMGNLMAESSMNPVCMTGKNIGMTPNEYVSRIKDGRISAYEFAHDGIAFGLVQWKYWSRKESLINHTGPGRIDTAGAQVSFLLSEIKTYKSVWNTLLTAKTVREASDAVMLKYEKPAGTSESAKAKRAAYGMKYYETYANTPVASHKIVITTVDRVLIRSGNGKSFPVITSVLHKGTAYEYVAKSENGWHAVKLKDRVGWISGDFSAITEKIGEVND